MAHRIAGRSATAASPLEDLRQVAMLGLVKAVDRYDPDRGTAFESYAVPTVIGEVKRHFRDRMWGLHVPRRVQELRNRVRAAVQELTRTPDARTPARRRHRRAHRPDRGGGPGRAWRRWRASAPLSLDAELRGADDGYALVDTLGSPEPSYDRVVQREALKQGLRRPARTRTRASCTCASSTTMTQSRIADRMGISQMHVSRLISRTCERLGEEVDAA